MVTVQPSVASGSFTAVLACRSLNRMCCAAPALYCSVLLRLYGSKTSADHPAGEALCEEFQPWNKEMKNKSKSRTVGEKWLELLLAVPGGWLEVLWLRGRKSGWSCCWQCQVGDGRAATEPSKPLVSSLSNFQCF